MSDDMGLRMVHNRERWHDKPCEVLEDSERMEYQREIRRAIAKVRAAQEILSSLIVPHDNSMEEMLQDRAAALASRLTHTELEVMFKFLNGQSPEEIAEERGLSERTVSNQLSTGCRKLGFGDRRELKGWGTAVSRFILTQPPQPPKD